MEIIDLNQGSPEWHEWRGEGIGSSDIATIMGANPYKSAYELWEEKCGLRSLFQGNQFTRHGNECEDDARQWMNAHMGVNLEALCVQDKEEPIFKASLDGFERTKNVVVEIKSPTSWNKIVELRDGNVPEMWTMQVKWALGITKATKGYLAIWDYTLAECFVIEYLPDDLLFSVMKDRARAFLDNVKRFTPPELSDSDYVEIDDDNLYELLCKHQDINQEIKELTKAKDELKTEIVEFGDDGNFKCQGFKICRTAPRKSYDIDKMVEDGIEVDKYLKTPSIGAYRILSPRI